MSKGNQAGDRSGDLAGDLGRGLAKPANQDAIAKRAYELFLQRGSVPGHEVDDWLQAEVELAGRADAEDNDAQTTQAGDEATESSVGPTRRPAARERGGTNRRNARQPTSH